MLILNQVSPLSIDLYNDVPGPPPMWAATFLCFCHVAAYKIFEFSWSITKSVTPVHSLISNTFFHVLPPSVVLNNPLSPPGDHKGPCDATNTVFGSSGLTIIFEMCSDFLSPIFFQVWPPFWLK